MSNTTLMDNPQMQDALAALPADVRETAAALAGYIDELRGIAAAAENLFTTAGDYVENSRTEVDSEALMDLAIELLAHNAGG